MKTLLILAYECDPYHRPGSTIGAQRPSQFAKHLPEFGWRCIVLCSDYKSRNTLHKNDDWKVPVAKQIDHYLKKWEQGIVSIYVPLPSLQYADAIDKMWLGAVNTHAEKGIFTAREGVWNTVKRKIGTFLKFWRGDHSQSWQQVVFFASVQICLQLKVDAIMAEHGPDAALYVGNKLNKKLGIPWFADFRDPALQGAPGYFRNVYRLHIKHLLKTSSFIINVNDVISEIDSRRFGKSSITVANGFDQSEFVSLNKRNRQGNQIVISYLGNLYSQHRVEDFLGVLKRLAHEFEDIDQRLKFTFRGSSIDRILSYSGFNEISKICDLQNLVSRMEAIQLMKDSDLLLLFSVSKELNSDEYYKHGVIPSKLYEYLPTGNPVICFPGDDGILEGLINREKMGIVIKTNQSLFEWLYLLLSNKELIEGLHHIESGELYKFSRSYQVNLLAMKLQEV